MSGALLSNLNPGARIRETSFFWRCLKQESYVPELYSGSRVIKFFIRPCYVWLRSHLPCHSILPYLGLGIVIFLSSFYNPIVSYTHLAKLRLALLLIPMVLIMAILKSERIFPEPTIFDLPLFFLLLTAILSMRTVQDIPALSFGLRELMSLWLFVMSIYLVIYIFRKNEIKRLFYFLSAAGLVSSFLFLLHLLIFKSGEGYLKNTFGNPNHLAHFLVLIYPLVLTISLDNIGTVKNLWRMGAVLIIVAIFFTFSMGAWASFFLSLPILALSFKKKWPLVLALGLISLVFFPFIHHKFLEGLSLGYGSTVMARIEVWKEAWRSIYQRPILGIGLGQFAASAKPYYAKEMYNAFNVFFHLAAVTGLLGLASFLWFLVRAFKLNLSILSKEGKERLYGGAILTSLSGGLIGFLWDTHLLAVMTNWLLGFLFGSLVVMAEHNKAEQSMGR